MSAFIWIITIMMLVAFGCPLSDDSESDGKKLWLLIVQGGLGAWGAYLLAHA